MAGQDGRHSQMTSQLLRHVMSSPLDADLKGDIFKKIKPGIDGALYIYAILSRKL